MPEFTQQPVDGVRISVDGRHVTSETTGTAAGPSVLVLITALGELGVTITSTYVGHEGTDTLAAHLVVSRQSRALERAEHSRDALPVTHSRERCLLDHAQQLQDALMVRTGVAVAVDIAPGALTRATHA